MDVVINAVGFAAEKHKRQTRKADGSPYINHCIRVMKRLSDIGVTDTTVLAAAVLHDVVEDTDATIEDLHQRFGSKVAMLVAEVTDDRSLPAADRKRMQVEMAAKKSTEAKLIKLADKIDNLESMFTDGFPPSWDIKRIRGYFVWNRKVTEQMRGISPIFDKVLQAIYERDIVIDGKPYPVIPLSGNNALLQEYYNECSKVQRHVV